MKAGTEEPIELGTPSPAKQQIATTMDESEVEFEEEGVPVMRRQ